MSLDTIVDVQIDKQTASVSRVGFGTQLIMSAEADIENRFSETAKVYTDLTELGSTGDNFDTTGVTYLMAQTIFSQNPRTSQIVVGKRANAPLMTVTLTPVVKNSTAYTVTINGEAFTFTSDATATDLEIVAGLLALINAGSQNVVASGTTVLTVEAADAPGGSATAGKPYTITFSRALFVAQNTTPDPGVATDLNTIRTAVDGNDDWYAVHLDSFGKAEITALAAAIEATKKMYFPTTFDADVLAAPTTDIGGVLQAADYARTALSWHETAGFADLGAGWAGGQLPKDPGSITWKFKSVAGVAVSTLSSNELNNLAAKNVNNYVRIAGNNMMQEGVTASGEFIDITRGIDFVAQRLQERVFGTAIRLPKIPFTDPGVSIIEGDVRANNALAISQSIFVDGSTTVTVPAVADTDPNDRAVRLLQTVEFTGVLAGAVHKVVMRGTVTV